MKAQVIDGKLIASDIRREAAAECAALKEAGIVPCLAVVLAGHDPASVSYVTGKRKALAEAGMADRSIELPETTTEEELLSLIARLNADDSVHGILVQLPLPSHINEQHITAAISPEKDVDGFHPVNLGRLLAGEDGGFVPCTPRGIVELLKRCGVETRGEHAVIVGRSAIVGRPLAALLLRRDINATVTVCHTGTRDLARFTREADILIAAAGRPGIITGDMIRQGACVIDVGVNRVPDATKKRGYRLAGDVNFEQACEVASYITPVPGGVGPMTIAMLLSNTIEAAHRLSGK